MSDDNDGNLPVLAIYLQGGVGAVAQDGQVLRVSSWSLRRPDADTEDFDVHVVGWNGTHGEGYTSSKLVSFDRETLQAVTTSGRSIQLVGRPGVNGDADYVWRRWCGIYNVTEWADVTEAVMANGLPAPGAQRLPLAR